MAPMLSHHSTRKQVTRAPSSKRRAHNHLVSAAALARALYSASVLDRATVFCFLQPQEMRLLSRNTQKPPVERRSSRHLAQSASEKTWREWEFDRFNCKPKWMVCLRYRRRRLTAYQWMLVGRCINWESLLTVKVMSGLVRDKYCKASTVLLYKVASGRGSPSKAERLVEEAIGELRGFASSIFVLPKRSKIYLF